MDLILGLDVSTSCTGWCIVTPAGKLVDIGSINLQKIKGTYKKADAVQKCLKKLAKQHKIKWISIEENLQAFRPGLSSAKTLSVLARFNGIVSLLSYQILGLEPRHLNVNAARKTLGIRIIRKSHGGKPTKHQVHDWVSDRIEREHPGYQWPMKTLKSGPRKGEVIFDNSVFDMADAYVIASALIYDLNIPLN
jgi:Holliday junction resolvasome RuvABC endonuclease subunit